MIKEIETTYHSPLFELINKAIKAHQENFNENNIQASTLLSIKTGGCPENCSYCSQSAHNQTDIKKTPLLKIDEVLKSANEAKNAGASRFCLGAAWREIRDGSDFDQVLDMIREVRKLGLETCCTLGMLNKSQANKLKEAGLDFYNHNIDTSEEFYKNIVQTREYKDRIETINTARDAGIKVCTGGILGLGESDNDRISFIHQLVAFNPQPESITINLLVPVLGTPMQNNEKIDLFILLRVIATLRLFAPKSMIRLSAGRESLSHELQFLCFLEGANSIFLGEKLLTSPNSKTNDDLQFLSNLGLNLK